MNLPIPIEALYAGLAGTVLALIIATWQQNWQLKVFFLLALRLAIGWHFLFEGLYKVHSHFTGPNDTTRVFSSEPYFKVAPGPLGSFMRQQFNDPAAVIADRVKASQDVSPQAFAKLTLEEQAKLCPASVADKLDGLKELAQQAIKESATRTIDDAAKAVNEAKDDAGRELARKNAELVRQTQQQRLDNLPSLAQDAITQAKAAYAAWVYGVEGRDTKVQIVSNGDVSLAAPQRLKMLESLAERLDDAEEEAETGLGNGYGTTAKRTADLRMEYHTAQSELAKDADAFVNQLRKAVTGGKAEDEKPAKSRGKLMDEITMWFLVAIGTGLLAGLFTRFWCVLGAGFLVMTYLNHPAFPWFPAPPGTEGNPVFVNKNVIECLAMLSLACMPTGRWLGLDALLFGVPREPKPGRVAAK